jgi:curli production assembly/transport component CsgF
MQHPSAKPRLAASRCAINTHALALLAVLAAWPCSAPATELVYQPVNPAFGGNPLNGPVLLNSAQAQDKHKDPDALANSPTAGLNQSPLQQFNDMLERAILGQLASAATGGVLSNGKLIPGTVETGNFKINIVDLGGGLLKITTTDKTTGGTSTFEVSQ